MSTGMDVEVAIFRALAREEKVIYCDDEETTMECGTLHFRNKVFPKSSSAASSEGSDSDDAGEEEDNPTNDVEDDANNNEGRPGRYRSRRRRTERGCAFQLGWADLV